MILLLWIYHLRLVLDLHQVVDNRCVAWVLGADHGCALDR